MVVEKDLKIRTDLMLDDEGVICFVVLYNIILHKQIINIYFIII